MYEYKWFLIAIQKQTSPEISWTLNINLHELEFRLRLWDCEQ